MPTLKIHRSAGPDFQGLYEDDPKAAKLVAEFIEQAKETPELLDTFTDHGYGKERSATYHVSKWLDQWHKGRNLWRVKIWHLENQGKFYRIVYAFDPPDAYYILGITTHDQNDPKDFYDDESHAFTKRVVDVYDALFGQ